MKTDLPTSMTRRGRAAITPHHNELAISACVLTLALCLQRLAPDAFIRHRSQVRLVKNRLGVAVKTSGEVAQ